MTGLSSTELKAVAVHLCSPQFRMVLYGGSNRLPIKGFNESNGLLGLPEYPLQDCKPIEVPMEKGGLYVTLTWMPSFNPLTNFIG